MEASTSEVVASSILPVYARCVCGKDLAHDDFILYMLEAGLTRLEIFNALEFISIQLNCCTASYEGLHADVVKSCVKTFGIIADQLEDRRKAMAVYYLYNRGVGLGVISHLLRLPTITGITPKKGDCPTCGNIIPNKYEVKQLLNEKKELAKYISMYDIPRSCCVNYIDKKKFAAENLPQKVYSAVRGVPVDEMDFMMCRECGTTLSAIHDSSLGYSENSVRTGKSDQHISGDCIRQAERWGLPMEIGFYCHNVENVCCRKSLRSPSLHYLASNKYNERRTQQNFISSVHLCK
jgi:DNA-directed RNA polymerase subunit N (RpoN/RPB10)